MPVLDARRLRLVREDELIEITGLTKWQIRDFRQRCLRAEDLDPSELGNIASLEVI